MQNLSFLQRSGRNAASPLLPGSIKKRITQKADLQQELHQKVSVLARQRHTGGAEEQISVQKEQSSAMFPISGKDIPGGIAGEMERYYQSAGNAVDNLTCIEEQIKYMQAEYDKAGAEKDDGKAEVLGNWMNKQLEDMSWTVSSVMGISHFRIDHAGRLYGEAFGKEAEEQLSGLHANTNDLLQMLRGAGSAEEALQRIADVKKELMQQADAAARRYEAYTGEQLSPYTYKGAEDYAGIKWDSHLIYNKTLGAVEGPGLSLNLGEYGKIDLGQAEEAHNLVNVRA